MFHKELIIINIQEKYKEAGQPGEGPGLVVGGRDNIRSAEVTG